MDYKLVEIKIIKRNYDKTKSMKFMGILKIVCNKDGIIYGWNIIFTHIHIDLSTTESWFNKKNNLFSFRKQLFSELGLIQNVRTKRSPHIIVQLSKEQIIIVNDFFNDKLKYDSSIKSIIGVLKGNSPRGEVQSPKSAEMIINSNDITIRNFVVLLDDLIIKRNIIKNKNNLFSLYSMYSEKITFNNFIHLNKSINNMFNFMQRSKEPSEFKHYLKSIKKYYETYYNDECIEKVNDIISSARSKYQRNIDNWMINNKLPFGFNSDNKYLFEKAHIVNVHIMKLKIRDAIKNNKSYIRFKNIIEDENNFIPLTMDVHNVFDRNHITYLEDGNICAIDLNGDNFINNYMDVKYKKIDSCFLNKKRKEYLHLRNNKKSINFI